MTALAQLQADWPEGARLEWTVEGEGEWYDVADPDVADPAADAPTWLADGTWYDADDADTWGPVSVIWQVLDADGEWLCGGTLAVDEPGLTRPDEEADSIASGDS